MSKLYNSYEEFRAALVEYKQENPNWQVIGFFELGAAGPEIGVVMVGDQPSAGMVPPGSAPHEIMALARSPYDVFLGVLSQSSNGNLCLTSFLDQVIVGSCSDFAGVPDIS